MVFWPAKYIRPDGNFCQISSRQPVIGQTWDLWVISTRMRPGNLLNAGWCRTQTHFTLILNEPLVNPGPLASDWQAISLSGKFKTHRFLITSLDRCHLSSELLLHGWLQGWDPFRRSSHFKSYVVIHIWSESFETFPTSSCQWCPQKYVLKLCQS